MHFDLQEFHERMRNTKESMLRNKVEVLIVSDPSNMAWLTGYDGWSFYVHQCVLLALDGEPVWLPAKVSVDWRPSLARLLAPPQEHGV